jgi:pyruvate kinase
VEFNKINKGGNKKNHKASKGSKALSKNSDGTTSIDIMWDLDGPDMRVDRLQQEFDQMNAEVEAQKKVVDDLLEQRR